MRFVTEGYKIKILAFVTEPWETEFISRILANLTSNHGEIASTIVISDTFSIIYAKDFVREITSAFDHDYITVNDLYSQWQNPGNPPDIDFDAERWCLDHCPEIGLETLLQTNQSLYAWEWGATMIPMTPEWRRHIGVSYIKWVSDTFDKVLPDAILTVGQRSMAANIAFWYARSKEIPTLTLQPARIGSRWIVRTDFGRGVGPREYKNIVETSPSAKELVEVAELRHALEAEGALFGFNAHDQSLLLRSTFSFRLKSVLFESMKLGKKLFHRHTRGGERDRAIKVIRFDQDFTRLTYFELRMHIIRFWLTLFGHRHLNTKLPTGPYLLWCLHVRPEDSTSSIGDGLDEFDILEKLSNQLPEGISLVVKEHASMLGMRPRSLYKKWNTKSAVVMMSPSVRTIDAVKSSRGVAGLSGTVLLEAALLDKPTIAFGRPEFDVCLSARGWQEFELFSKLCTEEGTGESGVLVERYLAFVLRNSSESGLDFFSPLMTSQGRKMIADLADRIWHVLEGA